MSEIYVTRPSIPSLEEFAEEIRDIWDTHTLTNMGPKHRKLQSGLMSYMGVDDIELFTNGHMALELTLQALELEGEVITTPYTFASTTHAIVRNGLTPVFCDIKEDDFTIDAEKIESLITEHTSAILPVHVYGNICDIDAIDQISRKHGLKVVYDAAHAFGETYKGKGVGTFGDASIFSFHATKVYNTIEGGATCYHDPELGKKLRLLKNFGIEGSEKVTYVGANAKMNEFSAAMGICNLRHIDEEIERRSKIAERYIERLNNIRGLKINTPDIAFNPNYAYLPIVIEPDIFGKSRDDVYDELKKSGIVARKYFYPITSAFDVYKDRFNPKDTPVAYGLSKKILTLPIYADLELVEVDRICDVIVG